MRITNSMMISHMMRDYNDISRTLDRTQHQVSTGKRYDVSSDDPVRMSQSMRNRNSLYEIDEYQKNISDAKTWMDSSESAMKSAVDVLDRVRELTVQAYNGTLPQDSRSAIASEIKTLTQELENIGNTDVGGRYIFNGQKTGEAPYGQGSDGYYEFNGDQGPGKLQYEIGQGVKMEVNIPPGKLYDNGEVDILTELQNLSADLGQTQSVNFKSTIDVGNIDVSNVNVTNGLNFDVHMGNQQATVSIAAGAYTGDQLVSAINNQVISGGINNIHVSLSPGNRLMVQADSGIDPNSISLVDNSTAPDSLTGTLGLNARRSVVTLPIPPNPTKLWQVDNYQGVVGVGSKDISSVVVNPGDQLSFQVSVESKTATVTLPPGTYTGVQIVDATNQQLTSAGISDFRMTLTQSNHLMMVADSGLDASSVSLKDLSTGTSLNSALGREEGIGSSYLSQMSNLSYTLGRGSKDISTVVLNNDLVWDVKEQDNSSSNKATITIPAVDGGGNPIVYSAPEIVDIINRQLASAGIDKINAYVTPTNQITFMSNKDVSASSFEVTDKSTGSDTLNSVLGLRSGTMQGYLQKIDAGVTNIMTWTSEIGARTNRVELANSRFQDTSLYITQVNSDLTDVDYAQAMTQLSMQENIQRTTLSVGAKIIQPTLVDFLK